MIDNNWLKNKIDTEPDIDIGIVSKKRAIGSHQSARMIRDEYFTPRNIVNSLGKFDLDPCTTKNRPWDTANYHFEIENINGLDQKWFGRVWLNPPYGKYAKDWLKKLSEYGNGIALIFARTETEMFFDYIWEKASGILFLRKRIHFYDKKGKRYKFNSGAPSCLIAYGFDNYISLSESRIPGKCIKL